MVSLLYEFQTNQVNRPGRNLITFLIFANLYMWLWETLDSKAQGEYYHARKKYYGEQVHFSLVSYFSNLYRDIKKIVHHMYTIISFIQFQLWTVISHMTLPLSIFYRFHSAVALVDIWSSAYKPADKH